MTDSQQSMYYQELIELRTRFEDFKTIITPQMLVEASPIQYKAKTLQAIKDAQQRAQQAGQAQAKAADDNAKLTNALTAVQISQAQENISDAQVNRSQIPLNNAKTISEVNKNLASPFIDLIKEQVRIQMAAMNLAARSQGGGNV